jgi:hypothetical protein
VFGGAVVVNLVSATGTDLCRPWRTLVQMEASKADVEDVESEVNNLYASLPDITTNILAGRIRLC